MAVRLSDIKLDCRICSPAQKIERGCEEDSPIPGAWKLDEWEFQRCPVKIITLQSVEYIRAYVYYTKGYLPNSGGWTNQPVKFIEAIEVIEHEIDKIKAEKEKNAGSKP